MLVYSAVSILDSRGHRVVAPVESSMVFPRSLRLGGLTYSIMFVTHSLVDAMASLD